MVFPFSYMHIYCIYLVHALDLRNVLEFAKATGLLSDLHGIKNVEK